MKRESLDIHDKRPEAMQNYLNYYGWHFNKKMCEFALGLMNHEGKNVKGLNKDKIDELFRVYNILLKNDIMWDKVYVAGMLKSDYLNEGIPDEANLAKAIKSYIDDKDSYDSKAFSHFYIDTIKLGIPIDWDEML